MEALIGINLGFTIALVITVVVLMVDVIDAEYEIRRVKLQQLKDQQTTTSLYELFKSLRRYVETLKEHSDLTQEHSTMVHEKLNSLMEQNGKEDKKTKKK